MYSYKMPTNNMQIYNRFQHALVDRQDTVTLVSLKFANVDWGPGQRFLEPIISPDGTKAFTYEMKSAPALSTALPKAGWNRRAVLIDLTTDRFQADSWQKIADSPFKLESDFKKLSLFWKDVAGFTSPQIDRFWQSILKVDEDSFAFKGWSNTIEMKFVDLKKIHFSKRAVNTLEVPNLEAEVKTGTHNEQLTLPQEIDHPFYLQLEKRNLLKKEDLRAFLESPIETELLVLSSLGGIQFQVDQGFLQTKAEAGVVSNGKLLPWQNMKAGQAPIARAQIGNLIIDKLEVGENRSQNEKFPANQFYFNFSKINEHETKGGMIAEIGTWSEILKTEAQVEFHDDWSTFFDLKNAVVEFRLSYSDSEGFGSFNLAPEFYRKLLLQQPQFKTDFTPDKNFKFKSQAIHVKDEYGFDPDQIFPTPDELHKLKLHFWSDAKDKMGLSDQGFLYVWNKSDLVDFQDEVSDEFGDRGGPYYESVLTFKNNASIRLSTGGEAIAAAKAFLLK